MGLFGSIFGHGKPEPSFEDFSKELRAQADIFHGLESANPSTSLVQVQAQADQAQAQYKIQMMEQAKMAINVAAYGIQTTGSNTASGTYTTTTTASIPYAGASVGVGGAQWAQAQILRPGNPNNNVNTISFNNVHPVNNVHAVYTLVAHPTGITHDIEFYDVDGKKYLLSVDASYSELLQQISAHHMRNRPQQVLPPLDFDLDELAAASELMEELDGARSEGH